MLTLGLSGACVSAKTLTFCSEGNPETLSPIFNTTSTSFDVTGQIFDNLVTFRPGTTEVMPALAQRWTVSSDGLVYVFILRQGVKWQSTENFKPTRHFNADDVLFTFERQWKSTHPFYAVTSAHHPYFKDMGMADMLKSIAKVDDYTVKFTLQQPVMPFVADLAMRWAGMQSACLRPTRFLQFNGLTTVTSQMMCLTQRQLSSCWPQRVTPKVLKQSCGPCRCNALICRMRSVWPNSSKLIWRRQANIKWVCGVDRRQR